MGSVHRLIREWAALPGLQQPRPECLRPVVWGWVSDRVGKGPSCGNSSVGDRWPWFESQTLFRLPHFSVPQFPHLQNGDVNWQHFLEACENQARGYCLVCPSFTIVFLPIPVKGLDQVFKSLMLQPPHPGSGTQVHAHHTHICQPNDRLGTQW